MAHTDRMIVALVSRSPRATLDLAERLGRALDAGTLVALEGDLGAGKTTFVRGLARGLGIDEGVSSPTYTLMQEHVGGRMPLYHFDAYMEGREKALLAEGADEFLGRDGVAVVEWAGRVEAWLPEPRVTVGLGHRSPEERTLELGVVGSGAGAEALRSTVRALVEALPEGIDVLEPAPRGPRNP